MEMMPIQGEALAHFRLRMPLDLSKTMPSLGKVYRLVLAILQIARDHLRWWTGQCLLAVMVVCVILLNTSSLLY